MTCSATITPLWQSTDLKAQWTAFEAWTNRSFFQSWAWLDTAIHLGADRLHIVHVWDDDGTLIALGWLCAMKEVRHRVLRVSQLRLHELGATADTAIAGEFNTLMTLPGREADAWSAFLDALSSPSTPTWDEVIISNAHTECEEWTKQRYAKTWRISEYMSARVNLQGLRDHGIGGIDGYLSTLRRNTRSQIRRAINAYSEHGSVELQRASTLEEAQTHLSHLAELHEQKWSAIGQPGLLTNTHLLDFYRALIDRHFNAGAIEMLHAKAGDETIGYLCNFADRKNILYNAGGFKMSADNRLKPGLVTQTLAIVDHLEGGNNVYDFMAGNDRYKFSLGERGPDMVQFAIQRPRPALIAEAVGRAAKGAIQKLPLLNKR